MGQLVAIDEEELNMLRIKANWTDTYRLFMEAAEKELYPNYITTMPYNNCQYDCWVIQVMLDEIKDLRKPWYKKIF